MHQENANVFSGAPVTATYSNNNVPVIFDHQAGEVLAPLNNTKINPPINPAYKIGKSGEELKIILGSIYHIFGSHVQLRINNLGTKYAILGYEFIVFDNKHFAEKLKKHAISTLGLFNISNKSIQNAITVLRESPQYWHRDPPFHNNPQLRVANYGYPSIYYFPNPQNPIHLVPIDQQGAPYPIGLLTPQSSTPFDHQHLLSALNYNSLNDFKLNPKHFTNNLVNLLELIGIPNSNKIMVISWLIYSLISEDFILLELINSKTQDHLFALHYLKALIDPSSENFQPIPKKSDEIYRIGLEHYLIGLNSNSRIPLSVEQQSALLELSFNNGAKIDANQTKNSNAKLFVKRPIILTAMDTLITETKLRESTITIPIPSSDVNIGGTPSDHQINSARLEMLQIAVLNSHVLSDENFINNKYFEYNRFENFQTYIHLGCEISHLLHRDNGKNFIDEFEAWALEDIFVQMDENDIALVIYKWAEEHKNSAHKHSIKNWIYELNHYAESEGIDIKGLSPRKIGADFKQAAPILKKLGIKIESAGRSRMSEWTITVMDKVDLKGSIILTPKSI